MCYDCQTSYTDPNCNATKVCETGEVKLYICIIKLFLNKHLNNANVGSYLLIKKTIRFKFKHLVPTDTEKHVYLNEF